MKPVSYSVLAFAIFVLFAVNAFSASIKFQASSDMQKAPIQALQVVEFSIVNELSSQRAYGQVLVDGERQEFDLPIESLHKTADGNDSFYIVLSNTEQKSKQACGAESSAETVLKVVVDADFEVVDMQAFYIERDSSDGCHGYDLFGKWLSYKKVE